MNIRVFSLIILSLVGGILLGNWHAVSVLDALFPFCIALGAFIIHFILSKKKPFHNLNWINEGSAFFLFLGIGLFSAAYQRPATISFNKGDYIFSGTVTDYTPTNYGDKLLVNLSQIYLIRHNEPPLPFDVRNVNALITVQDATNISYGSEIKGIASLSPIDSPANFKNDDYIAYLKQKKIFLSGFTDASKCNFIKSSGSIFSFFLSLRDKLEAKIESTFLHQSTKSFIISVILGDKSYIDKDNRLTFSDAGVAHIFAVSGLHVSLISFGLLAVLSFFLFGNSRKWAFFCCIPLVWFYILLVGFSPATCRAGFMITVSFLAFFLQRKHNALKALGWAVIIILAFFPAALFDIGFQLSVVSVGSLILIASPLNFVSHKAHPGLFALVSVILVSVVSTFSCWIICSFYFHRFSLMFLPLNLIAVPLLPIFIIASIVYIFLFYCGMPLHFLASAIDNAYLLFQKGASWVTSFASPIENLHPHFIAVFFWLIGLLFLSYFLNRQRKNLKLLSVSLIFFSLTLISIIFFPKIQSDGFIIQKTSSALSVVSYDRGHESLITIPDGDAVKTEINGYNVITLRSDNLSDSVLRSLSNADYLLIGKGCKSLPQNFESYIPAECKIVTHPSLHWRYERNMIAEAQAKNLSIHSLRYNGPLHNFKEEKE